MKKFCNENCGKGTTQKKNAKFILKMGLVYMYLNTNAKVKRRRNKNRKYAMFVIQN